ncbi:MAG TPA: alpha/beta hydrolase [Caulobacter sp.]|nr:alpha/beta hydrolase [Caulobacter sp.]
MDLRQVPDKDHVQRSDGRLRRKLRRYCEGGVALAMSALCFALSISSPGLAAGRVMPFPSTFQIRNITVNGATIHVRVGGAGQAVVLLHGYGETGDMWAPLAARLARDHRVVIPDLRGMGLSSKPAGDYAKMNQATDIANVLDDLGIDRADVVSHDVGNMVAFAMAEKYANRVNKLVVIDAPIPGIGPWDEIVKSPQTWHFRFGGPDMERLVKGRERIYLDRFWNEFSADPNRFGEAERRHYARLYSKPGAMHAVFEQYRAFDQDAADNQAWISTHGQLTTPVLALGAQSGLGAQMAVIMRAAAVNVTSEIIPDSGHWIMQENPDATTLLVTRFLESP